MKHLATGLAAMVAWTVPSACDEPDLSVPSAEVVESYYSITAEHEVNMRGNVAELVVVQAPHQLARGGRLWAKVGPYIFLFSEPTRELFQDHDGLAAVRVVTTTTGGKEVARATLRRDALNDITWRRALNIAGRARRDGTRQPTLLEDLVAWGEDHTDFEYAEGAAPSP